MKPYCLIHDFTAEAIEIFNKYREKQNNARLKLRFAALIFPALKSDIALIASALGNTVITMCQKELKALTVSIINRNSHFLIFFK